MNKINITKEPVELYKILKFEGLVASGGEAKAAIDRGDVWLNGVCEKQRRKKVVSGDIIKYMGKQYDIFFIQTE